VQHFLWILCRYSTLFLEIKIQNKGLQNLQIYYIQIYKHLALTVSDIRINGKITSNSEKCRHLLHRRGTWMLSPEAKLNLSQISAKYLINNTPNCFVPDAAVVSAELGNSSAEKSLFLHQFCAGRPILRKIQNPAWSRRLSWYGTDMFAVLYVCWWPVSVQWRAMQWCFIFCFFYSYVHLYITIYRDCSCGKQH